MSWLFRKALVGLVAVAVLGLAGVGAVTTAAAAAAAAAAEKERMLNDNVHVTEAANKILAEALSRAVVSVLTRRESGQ